MDLIGDKNILSEKLMFVLESGFYLGNCSRSHHDHFAKKYYNLVGYFR